MGLSTEETPQDDPSLMIVPPNFIIEDWENPPATDLQSERHKNSQWPQVEPDCGTTTYRRGRILIRERNLSSPPLPWEETLRTLSFNAGPSGWCIAPGNGTYDENKDYPWISREEMGQALDWVRNLPGTQGKHFYVHSIDNEQGIAITLGRKSPRDWAPNKPPVHRRVLELRREEGGALTARPGHSLECITEVLDDGNPCNCESRRDRAPFTISPGFLADEKIPQKLDFLHVPTIDQMMEKLTVRTNEVPAASGPTIKVFGCKVKRADGDLDETMETLGKTTSLNMEGLTNRDELPDGRSERSTPPTTSGGEDIEPLVRDKKVIKSVQNTERHIVQERTYPCNTSRLSQRSLARPWESDREAVQVRPLDELPAWGFVVGLDGYEPGRTYPQLSRQEREEIINWCDNLPEYAGGGFRFLLHRTEGQTIGVTLIGNGSSPKRPRLIGERVIELTRDHTRRLWEVSTSRTVSRGRYNEFAYIRDSIMEAVAKIEGNIGPKRICDEKNYQVPYPATMDESHDSTNPPLETLDRDPIANPIYSCLATTFVYENQSKSEGLAQVKSEQDNEKSYRRKPEETRVDKVYPQIWRNLYNVRSCPMQMEIDQHFPVPLKIRYAPPPEFPSNGVLAAREIIPYAQNDDASDFVFYAKGITLVLDDNEGKPTYYRGNAAIRVSRRNLDPEMLSPKRNRTTYLREKMFNMSPRVRRSFKQQQKDVPTRDDETLSAGLPKAPQSYEKEQEGPTTDGKAATEPKLNPTDMKGEKRDAVKRSTVNERMEGTNESMTYRMKQNANGSFHEVRTTTGHMPTINWFTPAAEKESQMSLNELATRSTRASNLTEKGNNPHPSDDTLGASTQNCAKICSETMRTGPEYGKIQGPVENDDLDKVGKFQVPSDAVAKGIKEIQLTPQNGTLDFWPSSLLYPTLSCEELSDSSTCRPPMPPRPPRNVPQPTNPPSLSPTVSQPIRECASLAATLAVPPSARPLNLPMGYSAPLGGGDAIRPTTRGRLRPGLMAATHLEERIRPKSLPREHWYEGLGATLVVEDEEGRIQVRQGRTEVRFLEQNYQNCENIPPPPPAQRTTNARAQLFRSSGTDPSEDENPDASIGVGVGLESPLRIFRFNPTAPDFEPRVSTATDAGPGKSSGVRTGEEQVEQEAAETLLAIKNLRPTRGDDAKTTTRERADSVCSSSPDETPTTGVKFVYGGTMPGTLDRSRDASPTLRIVDEDPNDPNLPGTCKTDDRISESDQHKPNSHPITTAPADAAMDVDREATEPPDTPPELEYPTSESSSCDQSEPTTRTPVYRQDAPPDSDKPTSTHNDQCASSDVRPRRPISKDFIHYGVWKEVIMEVRRKLADGERWDSRSVQERLGAFGLLAWWYAVNLKESGGSAEDWEMWRNKIVDVWRKRHPDVGARVLDSMAADLRDLDRDTRPMRILQCQAAKVEVKSEQEDVEMKSIDAPRSPDIIPVWLPTSPPPEARDAVRAAAKDAKIIQKDWADLQERVRTLEKKVTETTEGIHDRLTRLGDQVYEDGIIVTDLKWRMAGIQETEEKAKAAGKRAYKKARGKAPTHRYPTRFSGAQVDDVLEIGRKEYGDVAARIQAVEERMEDMKKEKERLEAELTRLDALAPKIDALGTALEEFKVSQLKINFGSFQHFANLRDFYTNTISPRLDAHARDIAALNARYASLYAVAVDVLKPVQNGRRPPIAKPKRASPAPPSTLANAFNKMTPLPPLRPIAAVL